MKERPILFSGPMVRAIREGRKTQTRRVVKHIETNQPVLTDPTKYNKPCPYGQPGDRLWVRETWKCNATPGGARITYRADESERWIKNVPENAPLWLADNNHWRPSIFMPRWAARIILEVAGVRVERLNDISEEDAIAEGLNKSELGYWVDGLHWERPTGAYRELWESINGAKSWDANPWVRVIQFRRVE